MVKESFVMKQPEITTLCYIEDNGKYLMMHRIKKENDIKLNELLSNPIADKKEEIGKLHSWINTYKEKRLLKLNMFWNFYKLIESRAELIKENDLDVCIYGKFFKGQES